MLKALRYARDAGWTEANDLSTISELCQTSGARVWAEADVRDLTEDDVQTIAEEFGLHPLAVEDALGTRERPKLEEYDAHLFTVVHELQPQNGQLEPAQISCFVGTRYVLALHNGADKTMLETRRRLIRATGDLWGGSAFLMHVLLDTIVDDYQNIADDLEDEIETLEETLLDDPRAKVDAQLYTIKQRLARFRRYVLPVSRMLTNIVDQGSFSPSIATVDAHFGAYFRDVHDHTLRIADQMRSVEDLGDALIALVRSEQQRAQDEAVKRVSAWAAIVAFPTLVASVYGMNFHLVPEPDGIFGFWFAVTLMASVGAALYIFFKRRGWI